MGGRTHSSIWRRRTTTSLHVRAFHNPCGFIIHSSLLCHCYYFLDEALQCRCSCSELMMMHSFLMDAFCINGECSGSCSELMIMYFFQCLQLVCLLLCCVLSVVQGGRNEFVKYERNSDFIHQHPFQVLYISSLLFLLLSCFNNDRFVICWNNCSTCDMMPNCLTHIIFTKMLSYV